MVTGYRSPRTWRSQPTAFASQSLMKSLCSSGLRLEVGCCFRLTRASGEEGSFSEFDLQTIRHHPA